MFINYRTTDYLEYFSGKKIGDEHGEHSTQALIPMVSEVVVFEILVLSFKTVVGIDSYLKTVLPKSPNPSLKRKHKLVFV